MTAQGLVTGRTSDEQAHSLAGRQARWPGPSRGLIYIRRLASRGFRLACCLPACLCLSDRPPGRPGSVLWGHTWWISSIPLLANSKIRSLGCKVIAMLSPQRADSRICRALWSCGGVFDEEMLFRYLELRAYTPSHSKIGGVESWSRWWPMPGSRLHAGLGQPRG